MEIFLWNATNPVIQVKKLKKKKKSPLLGKVLQVTQRTHSMQSNRKHRAAFRNTCIHVHEQHTGI